LGYEIDNVIDWIYSISSSYYYLDHVKNVVYIIQFNSWKNKHLITNQTDPIKIANIMNSTNRNNSC